MYDVIIIGAGPAGLTAAIYAKRNNLELIVVSDDLGGQVGKSGEIDNYPGLRVKTGMDLVKKFEDHAKELGVEIKTGAPVISLTKKGEGFVVKYGEEEIESKAVIVASGRKPRKLDIPGEVDFTNKGVSYCWVCDGPLFKDKDIAVIGGGNSAVEAVLGLAAIGKKVYIININSEIKGEEILLEKIKDMSNIEIIPESATQEIQGNALVEGIKVGSKEGEKIINVDGVFIEIGSIPNTDFLGDLVKLNQWNEIEIDSLGATSVPGIFAAGDVTNIPVKQIVVASAEGAKAALAVHNYLTKK